MTPLTPNERRAIAQHAAKDWPREACGVIVSRGTERTVLVAENALPPDEAPVAFVVDPKTLQGLTVLVEHGWQIEVIYHSHTNGSCGMSAGDRELAAPGGVPRYPGTMYVIASLRSPTGSVTIQCYEWERGQYRRVGAGKRVAQRASLAR